MSISFIPAPDDDSPRMVALVRKDREVVSIGAADAADAARQAAILVLNLDGGLRVGDVIQVTRV